MASVRRELAHLALVLAVGCQQAGDVETFSRPDAGPGVAPTHIDLSLISEASRSNPGWSGVTYGAGPPAGSDSTSEIISCDEETRRCRFRGPVKGLRPIDNQRCLNDLRIACDEDADCGEDGLCRFMFPPFPTPTGFCSVVYFEPEPGAEDPSPSIGVVDLWTGDLFYDRLNARVAVSLTECVDCLGDTAPRDGQADGLCDGTNIACDVAGNATTPAAATSYDCAPNDFTGLTFAVPTAGASTIPTIWTMNESRPSCTAPGFENQSCWCGVCEGTALPCHSDAECGPGGRCGWPGEDPDTPTYLTAPNRCAESCKWDEETQTGTCLDVNGAELGCLPESGSIQVRAGAEVKEGYYVSTIGLLTCLPSSGNQLVDALAGFPGPLFYEAAYRVTPRYPE